MAKPLTPERAKQIAGKIEELSQRSREEGEAAAGAFIRDHKRSGLPFENEGDGKMTARIPIPDGGSVGVSYDPATPPHTDFDFSAYTPDNQPRNVPGIQGMQNGTAKVPPTQLGPAIERASGIDKTTQFAARVTR